MVLLSFSTAAAAATPDEYVLLFSKNCARCREGAAYDASGRANGGAVLELLERRGTAFVGVATWRAWYGRVEGPKHALGDHRTPEGMYRLDWIFEHPGETSYGGWSILTSYPNAYDAAGADDPGGSISIHGGQFWPTDGCIRLREHASVPGETNGGGIAELLRYVRTPAGVAPIPLVSTRQADASCLPAPGQSMGGACAQVLGGLLDSPTLPTRETVNSRLAAPDRALETPTYVSAAGGGDPWGGSTSPSSRSAPDSSPRVASATASSEAEGCVHHADSSGAPVTCSAAFAVDGDAQTAWCEGAPGVGTGERLVLRLAARAAVSEITVLNGYQKGGVGSSTWARNGRATRLEVTVGDRTFTVDTPEARATIAVPGGAVATDTVSVRFVGATASRDGDTCLSEVSAR